MKLLLIIAVVLLSACMAKPKPDPNITNTAQAPTKDTLRTTVLFATDARQFQAKVYYQSKMVDTFEPANDDSTLWRPIRKKVYDKLYFIHVVDSAAKTPTGKRILDTFYQVNPKFVIEDLNKKW